MTNSSKDGGPITPISLPPVEDDAFDAMLHTLVAGVTGLPGDKVRRKWQDTLPQTPEPNVDWCGFSQDGATNSADRMQITHDPNGTIVAAGDGADATVAWEQVEASFTFYGPHSWANSSYLNDGLRVQQNREALYLAGVNVSKVGPRRALHEFLDNKRVYRRVDINVTFNRTVQRVYAIYNILSAQGTLYSPSQGASTPMETPFNTIVGGTGKLPPYR